MTGYHQLFMSTEVEKSFKAVFTNLNASGRFGPTRLGSHYTGKDHDGQVTLSRGIQNWTVHHTGDYRIEAIGAAGGYDLHANNIQHQGRGARMIGTFSLNKGGGGGGFYSTGRSGKNFAGTEGEGGEGGKGLIQGGVGGRARHNDVDGGFGGGGGACGGGKGGGGGGYSGGGSGNNYFDSCGGGGGSYNGGNNQDNECCYNTAGHCQVIITFLE
ncbi:hypothetical protein AWC38_SpisGene21384 [Stylophora pistillata]|uniref:Uncharacterized protein n=1 Tax=Stylophora pistillata TaxID=50429 RepID=A0A2B4RDX8_STYPI|nr:hypothetical protein AWC38_SpisGene21384 [Stylophora pistillata]